MAYVCILMGDGHSCDFFLKTALELSETQGNLLEKCWLNMSKVRTSSHQASVCWGYVCGELTLLKKQQKSLLGWVLDGMGSHCLSPLGLTGCLPPTVLQAGESKTVALELNI